MSADELHILKHHIGAIVKKHREKMGVSQLNMGLDIEMSANQIGRIERAESNPTIATLFTIANYFEFDIIEFFQCND